MDEIRWNPTIKDITVAEKILKEYLKKYCRKYSKTGVFGTSFICKNLDDYIRQYIGKFHNEQKILHINCFWKGTLKEYYVDWKSAYNDVFDGGYYYWYMNIDMNKRKVVVFYIHGHG